MSFFPDLSHSCLGGRGADVRAVGWLAGWERFPQGVVPSAFVTKLKEHLQSPWQHLIYMGFHECDLPHPADGARPPQGHLQLYIPTETCVYIAPELIGHYVCDHGYRPPAEFIDALLACPPQGSPEFLALIAPMRCPWNGFLFDRQAAARHVEVPPRGNAWVRRGMCPECRFWVYLQDGDPAVHCGGQALVRLEERSRAG